jgi:hypothetical protein
MLKMGIFFLRISHGGGVGSMAELQLVAACGDPISLVLLVVDRRSSN